MLCDPEVASSGWGQSKPWVWFGVFWLDDDDRAARRGLVSTAAAARHRIEYGNLVLLYLGNKPFFRSSKLF